MEQEFFNKFEIIQTDRMEIQNPDNSLGGDQQVKSNNVSKQEKALQNANVKMDATQTFKDRHIDHKTKVSKEQESEGKDVQIAENSDDLPNDRILDKKYKIKHNKKCSGCFKKHLNKDVVECGSCPKSFHRACLPAGNSKKTEPFLCENCQEVIKQKNLKKTNKLKTTTQKLTQFQKMIKPTEPCKGKVLIIEDTNPSIQKELLQFSNKYPLYINNGKIQFPVEDTLFDEFPLLLKKGNNIARPCPTQILSSSFGTVLEVWNTIQTFDEDFQEHSDLSVWQLSELLQSKDNLIIIQRLYIKFVQYLSRDIFTEKFEANKQFINNPFLFLLKYCSETGMLDKILKYVWVEFLSQISRLTDFQIMFNKNTLKELIQNLRLKINQQLQPQSLENKIFIFQSLLNGIVESNSYHDSLSLKMEKGKQNTKLKQLAIQKVKELEGELRDVIDVKKKNQKIIKNLTKQATQQGDKQKFSADLQKVEKQQKQTLALQIELQDLLKIERQNVGSASDGNVIYTNVQFMGKDKENRDYWYVPNYRDKLFVSDTEGWFEYDSLTINELIKSLNIKGVREKQLLEKLQQYKKNNYFRPIDKNNESKVESYLEFQKEFQENRTAYLNSTEIDFEKQEFISFDFIKKILLLGQRKMTTYLEEKGARWGPIEDRQAFTIRVNNITTNRQLIEAAKFLNDRVCVVEIEATITDEEGQENVQIGKLRKVQTKLWGINQKYKHAWLQYLAACNENLLIEVFFLNAILYLTIDRYVSKMRVDSKRGKKQFSQQAPSVRSNRILNKQKPGQNNNGNKFEWDQTCGVCSQFGQLLCCDLCPKVFHLNCIGLSQVPQGSYQCKQCQSKRHTRSVTKKIVDTGK